MPKKNKNDMTEVPKDVQRGLKFCFAEDMSQVLSVALGEKAASLIPLRPEPEAEEDVTQGEAGPTVKERQRPQATVPLPA